MTYFRSNGSAVQPALRVVDVPKRIRAAAFVVCLLTAGCSAAIDPMAIADAQAAARVKTVLVNDPGLGGQTIEVRVVRGVGLLSGRVRTQAEADRAVALARSVDGVLDVRTDLQIGGPSPPEGNPPQSRGLPEVDSFGLDTVPGLLAVGASAGWRAHRTANLRDGWTLWPVVKLGSGRGFGPAVGFDWFSASVESTGASPGTARIRVKPIMAGVGYTLARDRVTAAFSVVGGYAFNSLKEVDPDTSLGLPIDIGNSVVWRPGVSLWVDTSRRTALNVSIGYIFTRLRLTTLDDGRLRERTQRGDALLVRAGVAYKLF
jgi:hypothetical protein